MTTNTKNWTIANARSLYNIPHWSGGYIDISDDGQLIVNSGQQPQSPHLESPQVNLYELAEDIKSSGLSLPCLVRFPHLLHSRVNHLKRAFSDAIQTNNYKGSYKPVYPIKVNQEQSVVSELLNSSDPVGLEAGSKPELMAVLAIAQVGKSVIICNGYKDREYIRLALIGKAMGHHIYIVLEKPSELEIVMSQSKAMDIKPTLGIRIRLDSIDNSKWQNTGGEKSKFGFSSSQVLDALHFLQKNDLAPYLELLHFHLGSQITNIEDIQKGANECTRYYIELHKAGAINLNTIDVGGGLGIDYEGTRSRNYFSMNYSITEYASCIVNTFTTILDQTELKHPHIITESGRAMVAHHAVLLVEVIETEQAVSNYSETRTENNSPDKLNSAETILLLKSCLDELRNDSCQPMECYHNANNYINQTKIMFNEGAIGLHEKALCEQLYYQACSLIRLRLNDDNKSHHETIDAINEKLADKYFCNFSLFQSLPDVWAINQIFPIVPLHRLNEKPTRRATIHDITCDSDGRIDSYVDSDGIESSLPLHQVVANTPYYLGIFLVGAYQEILGDMHNLFGDTNAINVELKNGKFEICKPQHGDSVEFVLNHVHYDTNEFITAYKEKLDKADLSSQTYQNYFSELKSGLKGYTYLED